MEPVIRIVYVSATIQRQMKIMLSAHVDIVFTILDIAGRAPVPLTVSS
jgi:hypothetical protein